MREHLAGGQRVVVDRNFIDGTGERIGPAVASGSDGPIAEVNRQRASPAGLCGYQSAIAIQSPVRAIVSSDEVNPCCASEMAAGSGESCCLGGGRKGAFSVARGTDGAVCAGPLDAQEDFG